MLTRMSDVAFGSDKGGLVSGCLDFNMNAGMSSNTNYGEIQSTGVSAHGVQSINPQQVLREQALGEDTSLSTCYQQASPSTSMNAISETASDLPTQMPYPNDFDLALKETEMIRGITEPNERALSWLGLWTLQNAGRLPRAKELKCLEILAGAPGKELMSWLKQHMVIGSERYRNGLRRVGTKDYCRPRCLDSRPRKIQSCEPKLFECTSRCGKKFPQHRKGDWARHERINFEGWACYVCTDVLTRKEHLQKHLKVNHDIHDIDLENHKHQLLDSIDRPCGFCGRSFLTWTVWLAHVAAHFEGSTGGRKWKIIEWKERKGKALRTRKRTQQSKRSRDDSEEDDDNDDDEDDNDSCDDGENGGGGGVWDNSGGSPFNSSYQPPRHSSGVDPDNGSSDTFGLPFNSFFCYAASVNSKEYGRIDRYPSLDPIDEVAAIDNTQEQLVRRMAVLDISKTGIQSASGSNAWELNNHQMARWLHERPRQEAWNSVAKFGNKKF